MVTLRLVDGKLSVLVEFGLQKLLDIWLGEKMLEISGEITFLVNIRSQESKRRFLHIAKGNSVRELALALMRNERPNSGMVSAAHGAEAEPKHINGMATKSKRTIPVELHYPAAFKCANGIKQKSW